MVPRARNGTLFSSPTHIRSGPASFDYTVTDGIAGSNTVTATFNVTNVNDAPAATGETISDLAEDSGANVILASTLLANDTDADNLTGAANAGLSIGSVSGAVA